MKQLIMITAGLMALGVADLSFAEPLTSQNLPSQEVIQAKHNLKQAKHNYKQAKKDLKLAKHQLKQIKHKNSPTLE